MPKRCSGSYWPPPPMHNRVNITESFSNRKMGIFAKKLDLLKNKLAMEQLLTHFWTFKMYCGRQPGQFSTQCQIFFSKWEWTMRRGLLLLCHYEMPYIEGIVISRDRVKYTLYFKQRLKKWLMSVWSIMKGCNKFMTSFGQSDLAILWTQLAT